MRRGLLVGRYQPFHIGHLKAVKDVMAENDEVIIAIGSAQFSHTSKNPFTAGERIEMIRAALIEASLDLSKIIIVPIPDIGSHNLWVARVKATCPRFQVVYSNNPLVTRLFKEAGYEVKQVDMYNRHVMSATEVRKRILEGKDWRELVPKSVASLIDQIKGVERMREIHSQQNLKHV